MSNLPNFPILRPSLLLDFANSRSVDPRIQCTRASSATRINERGVLESVAAGVPRIDHDPVTGECKGLLIEESRTNSLTYSEQLDNAAWIKINGTVTANASAAPDGTLTAEAFIEGTTAAAKMLQQDVSVTAGVTYTISVFAKTKGRDIAVIGVDLATNAAFIATFNFTAQTVTLTNSNGGTTISGVIQPLSNGWFRCSVTGLPGASCTTLSARLELRNGAAANYTGDGTSGLYIWGAQLEAGASPTSYIPTTTAAVTRAADVARMTGNNFSSWYLADEGTFVSTFSRAVAAPSTRSPILLSVKNSVSQSNSMSLIGSFSNPSQHRFDVTVSGTATAQLLLTSSLAAGKVYSVSAAYKTDDIAASWAGAAVLTDTSSPVPAVDSLFIGGSGTASSVLNGHIQRLAYYPRRLANAELQALTA